LKETGNRPKARSRKNEVSSLTTAINGNRDQLEGKLQERYGIAKDMVRKNVDDWLKTQP
jgi:hypothetical protein